MPITGEKGGGALMRGSSRYVIVLDLRFEITVNGK